MAEKPYRYSKEDNSKTIIVIGILLILIIVVGGGLLMLISQKTAPPVQNQSNQTVIPKNTTNTTNVTPTCDDQCNLASAVNDKNFSRCLQISSNDTKESCYEQLSADSFDACKAVTNSTKKDTCITAFAVSTRDSGLCDLISADSERNQCKLAIDPCYNATDKKLCTALATSDPSVCAANSTCLLNYSMTKKDPQPCSLIQSDVEAAACESSVRYTDKCSSLPLQAQRDLCYELYAINTNDYLTCTSITMTTTYAIDCFSYFAAAQRNLSICDVFSLDERWACYRNYSYVSGDLSGCQSIDPLASTNIFQCVYNYALKYGNPAACQVINDTLTQRSTCYQGAIIYYPQNLDWHTCQNVTNFNWMNKCYTESAKKYNDVGLCNYISADFAKQSCIDAYNANKTIS